MPGTCKTKTMAGTLLHELFKEAQNGNLAYFVEKNNDKSFQELLFTSCHNISGDTVLHYASRHGQLDLLKFLVENHFNLEVGNFDGKRALHEVAQCGQLECMQLILSCGVNIDSLKRADWTPLMLACTKDNIEVIKTLVEKGASLTLRNKDGWNCFHVAVREGYLPIIEYILQEDSSIWKTRSKNGRTPLHTAAIHGHTNVVRYLLSHCQYIVDDQDSCGSTPFMDAVRIEAIDIARILLSEQEVSVCIEDKLGRQALHVAVQSGAVKSVDFLIRERCVNPCIQCTCNEATALHIAAKEGHVAVIQSLLKCNADINAVDSKGRTALHIAAGGQHVDCVRILLENSAQHIPDFSGTSPRKLAKKSEVIQIFDDFENT